MEEETAYAKLVLKSQQLGSWRQRLASAPSNTHHSMWMGRKEIRKATTQTPSTTPRARRLLPHDGEDR